MAKTDTTTTSAEPTPADIEAWEAKHGPVVELVYDEVDDEFMPESCKRTVYFKKVPKQSYDRFQATYMKKPELFGVAALRALETCALHPTWAELKVMYEESPGLSGQHFAALCSASGYNATFTARRASRKR
jgi:hypothetical protein